MKFRLKTNIILGIIVTSFALVSCARYEGPVEIVDTPIQEEQSEEEPGENKVSEENPMESNEESEGDTSSEEKIPEDEEETPLNEVPITNTPIEKPKEEENITEEPNQAPVEETTTKDIVTSQEIPFETIRVKSDKVPKGTEMTSQEGKSGKKESTHRVTYKNGKEVAREVLKEQVVLSPVSKIITVGTGSVNIPKPATPPPAPVFKYKNVTDSEVIPFQTVRVNDSTIDKGKEVVSTFGKNGTREIVTQITYSDGVEVSRRVVSNQITVQPANQVILVGSKITASTPVITKKTETKTETVSFKTTRVNDPNMEKGKEVLSNGGMNGSMEIITEITYSDGKEISRREISRKIVSEPLDCVIIVGTKENVQDSSKPLITYSEYTETDVVPFEGKEIPDDTMFKGETKVVTAGVNGVRTIVTRKTFTDGRLTKEEVISDTITKQPVTQVIHYGTKEVEAPKGITSSAQITALFEAHNTARVNSGLEPLTWSSSLANSASIRAGEISLNGHFSHTRPNGKSFSTVGSGVIGENIAYGGSNGLTAFNMFWGSAGHKANILRAEFKTIGISTHYASDNGATYWAVLFGY
ncbi:G5 domain-containing protein [Proteiniclasticum ruminis]|uniref:G5 domain-containing protein n=1 Tax=Proteiniclasticum ruminis TaxID=398199 RepID=UPI0028ABEF15|nr:G5 domain-containing protein [Proteiniclasticum ruminis]